MPELEKLTDISPEHYRYEEIVSVTNSLLAETAFMQERDFTEEDVKLTKSYLVEAAKYADPTMFPNFWETTALAAIYAREISQQLQHVGINEDEVEALALVHDLGRFLAPGQYYRNDLLADRLVTRTGMRPEVMGQIHSVKNILGLSSDYSYASVDDMSPITRALMVGDWLGKRNAKGELVTPEEIINASRASFIQYGQDAEWPSTHRAMTALEEGGKQNGEDLFTGCIEWCVAQGVDFEALRDRVESRLASADYQQWIRAGLESTETLNKDIDMKLHRPSIKHIVFDIGGVLFADSQQDLINGIARDFGVAAQSVENALEELHGPEYNSGIAKPADYLPRFFGAMALGRDLGLVEMQKAFNRPEIYRTTPGVPEIVLALEANPDLKLSVLSDSITPVVQPLHEAMRRLYPGMDDIMISAEIGAAKTGVGDAFDVLINHLGNPDPRSIVFIDNKPQLTQTARKRGLRTITFTDNPYGRSAAVRLADELSAARLI